jgi:uncharacterized protein (UPF0147 family)
LDKETFSVMERMVSQIQVILDQEVSDNLVPENVMSVIEQLVKRMCKV